MPFAEIYIDAQLCVILKTLPFPCQIDVLTKGESYLSLPAFSGAHFWGCNLQQLCSAQSSCKFHSGAVASFWVSMQEPAEAAVPVEDQEPVTALGDQCLR